MNKIILASASPRRKELLAQIGMDFAVCVSACEEVVTKSAPQEVVCELSALKAGAVYEKLITDEVAAGKLKLDKEEDFLVIGSDTIVAFGEKILGKPNSREDAFSMLSMLEGNTHEVYTGVTFAFRQEGKRKEHTFYEKTEVEFYPMSEKEIRDYIATSDPMDKAGSYGIQGIFAKHVKGIKGDYNNVVGLPVGRLYQELKECGLL
ncbi:MAG: Maf family protein [Lachnospiraceae bacterium]